MVDFEDAKFDPAKVFSKPQDVLSVEDFSEEQKIEILKRWRSDIVEQLVAEEENMAAAGSGHDAGRLLTEILMALHTLGAKLDLYGSSPTKHGE